MLEQSTLRGKIISAAFEQAAERPWAKVTMSDIAAGAEISLAELRKNFRTKAEILEGFIDIVDDALLRRVESDVSADDSPRDRLFDVIMLRLEVMTPFKAALKNIIQAPRGDLSRLDVPLRSVLGSQYWVLTAAGISTSGLGGVAKIAGLSALYSATLKQWLEDDDPGMAKTMAGLDRRLRRGESWLGRASTACNSMSVVAKRVCEMRQNMKKARAEREKNTGEAEIIPPGAETPSP